jgi:ribose 5-phosphate isomerase RpiB
MRAFVAARFTGEERHRRRLAKVALMEEQESGARSRESEEDEPRH